jgi:hypothetical protein
LPALKAKAISLGLCRASDMAPTYYCEPMTWDEQSLPILSHSVSGSGRSRAVARRQPKEKLFLILSRDWDGVDRMVADNKRMNPKFSTAQPERCWPYPSTSGSEVSHARDRMARTISLHPQSRSQIPNLPLYLKHMKHQDLSQDAMLHLP